MQSETRSETRSETQPATQARTVTWTSVTPEGAGDPVSAAKRTRPAGGTLRQASERVLRRASSVRVVRSPPGSKRAMQHPSPRSSSTPRDASASRLPALAAPSPHITAPTPRSGRAPASLALALFPRALQRPSPSDRLHGRTLASRAGSLALFALFLVFPAGACYAGVAAGWWYGLGAYRFLVSWLFPFCVTVLIVDPFVVRYRYQLLDLVSAWDDVHPALRSLLIVYFERNALYWVMLLAFAYCFVLLEALLALFAGDAAAMRTTSAVYWTVHVVGFVLWTGALVRRHAHVALDAEPASAAAPSFEPPFPAGSEAPAHDEHDGAVEARSATGRRARSPSDRSERGRDHEPALEATLSADGTVRVDVAESDGAPAMRLELPPSVYSSSLVLPTRAAGSPLALHELLQANGHAVVIGPGNLARVQRVPVTPLARARTLKLHAAESKSAGPVSASASGSTPIRSPNPAEPKSTCLGGRRRRPLMALLALFVALALALSVAQQSSALVTSASLWAVYIALAVFSAACMAVIYHDGRRILDNSYLQLFVVLGTLFPMASGAWILAAYRSVSGPGGAAWGVGVMLLQMALSQAFFWMVQKSVANLAAPYIFAHFLFLPQLAAYFYSYAIFSATPWSWRFPLLLLLANANTVADATSLYRDALDWLRGVQRTTCLAERVLETGWRMEIFAGNMLGNLLAFLTVLALAAVSERSGLSAAALLPGVATDALPQRLLLAVGGCAASMALARAIFRRRIARVAQEAYGVHSGSTLRSLMGRFLDSMQLTPLQLAPVQALYEQAAPDLFPRLHAAGLGLGALAAPAVSISSASSVSGGSTSSQPRVADSLQSRVPDADSDIAGYILHWRAMLHSATLRKHFVYFQSAAVLLMFIILGNDPDLPLRYAWYRARPA